MAHLQISVNRSTETRTAICVYQPVADSGCPSFAAPVPTITNRQCPPVDRWLISNNFGPSNDGGYPLISAGGPTTAMANCSLVDAK